MKAASPYSTQQIHRGRTLGSVLIGIGILELFALGMIHGAISWKQRLPEIQSGDTAPTTVKTPVAFTVEDVRSTRHLRDQESRRIRPIFEYDSHSSERVANRFLEKYDSKQIQFTRRLQKNWKLPLNTEQLASEDYANFLTEFRTIHPEFPLSDRLAEQWARNQLEDDVRRETANQIREQQRRYITSSAPQPAPASNHPEYWMMTKNTISDTLSMDEVKKQAHILPVKSVQSIAVAKKYFFESMPNREEEWKQFAMEFLEPNLVFSEQLTASTRHDATATLIVHREFKAGDDIVVTGGTVSETQSAALAKLGKHYAARNTERQTSNLWLILVGTACVTVGFVIRSMNPGAGVSSVVVASGETGFPRTDGVQLKRGLLDQMSRWLKEQFIVRLIDQRNEAIDNQAGASSKLEQINTRLNKLQPEIRERIATYERRIEDLEKELLESTAINRELIQSRILMARKELEIEKARSKVTWN